MSKKRSSTISPLSWVDRDPEYDNRRGYDADFLDLRVLAPKLSAGLQKTATLSPLLYEHFTVLLNPERKLQYWTAVNVDGSTARRPSTRKSDV